MKGFGKFFLGASLAVEGLAPAAQAAGPYQSPRRVAVPGCGHAESAARAQQPAPITAVSPAVLPCYRTFTIKSQCGVPGTAVLSSART